MRPRRPDRKPPSEYLEKVVQVNRVSKKTKGGNQIGFSVLVVVGDKKGKVGVALGKAPDVLSSIKKGVRKAKKRFIKVPIQNGTIPFRIEYKHGAAVVMLKPAPPGSGIIAGGAVRDVVEAAGIRDIVGKIMGSNNQANNAYATLGALNQIATMVNSKGIQIKDTPPKAAAQKPQPKKDAGKKPASKKTAAKKSSTTKKTTKTAKSAQKSTSKDTKKTK